MIDALGPGTNFFEIAIPEPSLVVLIGAAGAGKSTFAQRWFEPDEILSSDEVRRLVSGDPADQSVSSTAFAILHRRLVTRLASGRLTVVDATNVHRSARRSLLWRAQRAGWPAVAIVLDLPPFVVQARNLARSARIVDPAVVDRQLQDLRRTLVPGRLPSEGFSAVHLITSESLLDAVRLVRVPM
jgi:protein phosphatase